MEGVPISDGKCRVHARGQDIKTMSLLGTFSVQGYLEFDATKRRVQVPRWRKGLIFLAAWPVKWGWW